MASDQEKQLIALLGEGTFVTAASLSKKLGVSERTVRTRIKALEGVLSRHGAHVVSKRSVGYSVSVEDRTLYDAFLRGTSVPADIPQTPRERSQRIVALLLESYGTYVSTESLAESLFVSNQTVYQNLEEVEQILASEGIALERRPGYGIRAEGSEYAARNCIVNNLPGATPNERFPILMDALHVIDRVGAYRTTDYNYADICRHIIVMLERHSGGHLVSTAEFPEVSNRIILTVCERVTQAVEERLGETVPPSERSYLAMVLASKGEGSHPSTPQQDDHVIPELVEEMLEDVRTSFGVELHYDEDIRLLLTEHLERLRERMRLGMQQRNPDLNQIRRDFGFAWAVAVQMSVLVTQRFGVPITDGEIGFLTLIFDMSLERIHLVSKGKSILLVCPAGKSSRKLVEFRFRAALGPLVSHIETTSAQRVNDFDLRAFNAILTTVDIVADTETPVMRVSLFPDDAEVNRVRTLLGKSRLPDSLAYFSEGRFVRSSDESDLTSAVEGAGRLLEADVAWSTGEALDNAVYQAGVLVVRPSHAVCEQPRCAVVVLSKPLSWGVRHRVQVLMFVSAGRTLNNLGYFYQVLGRFLGDAGSVGRLIRMVDYQRFVEDWTQYVR